ncbi:MAG: DUF3572 domain-containing protein [Rhizobiaceae bacterium]|jgi:hypothetical protein|nr:DUF3572 domain-containing protein [Rhizobiaceae bacterium]
MKEESRAAAESPPLMRHRPMMTADDAEMLAVQALAFIASDADQLTRFASLTGLDAGDIQTSARQPGFLAGVLAHLLQDEEALLAFAAAARIKPVTVPLAFRVIPGGDPMLEINMDAFR